LFGADAGAPNTVFPESYQMPNSMFVVNAGIVARSRGTQNRTTSASWSPRCSQPIWPV
jgi:hypothetical protein